MVSLHFEVEYSREKVASIWQRKHGNWEELM